MKLIYLLLVVLLNICSPSFAAIEAEPKEINIVVSNVPVKVPSLFIPLKFSSNDLDLYQISLKDIFVRGYVANIERDEAKNVIGVSFASLRAGTLPEKLHAVIKVRPAQRLPQNKNGKSKYPQTV